MFLKIMLLIPVFLIINYYASEFVSASNLKSGKAGTKENILVSEEKSWGEIKDMFKDKSKGNG